MKNNNNNNNDTNNNNATTPGEEAARNYVRACNKARMAAEEKSEGKAIALMILLGAAWLVLLPVSAFYSFTVVYVYLLALLALVVVGTLGFLACLTINALLIDPVKTLLN